MQYKSIETVKMNIMKLILISSIIGSSLTTVYFIYTQAAWLTISIQVLNIATMYICLYWLIKTQNPKRVIRLVLNYMFFYLYMGLWFALGFFHYMVMLYSLMMIMCSIIIFDGREMTKKVTLRIIIVFLTMFIDYLDLRNKTYAHTLGELIGIIICLSFIIYLTYTFKIVIQENLKQLEIYSYVDPLTNAKNFRAFMDDLQQAKSSWLRHQKNYALIAYDLNAFKSINDTYGHQKGNCVLCEVVNHIKEVLRAGDEIYRTGGDEFVILLNNCNKDHAIKVLNRLPDHHTLELNFDISLSFGLADASETDHEVLDLSDQRMYVQKSKYMDGIKTSITHLGGIKVFHPS